MRGFRTVNMVEGQKIESDMVLKRIGDISYKNLGTIAKAGLFDEGKALIVGDGLRVEPSSGMTVSVPTGSVFQRFVDVIPCISTESQTVTLDAASGVARVDIIEAQIKKVSDKNDIVQVGTVGSGTSIAITNETIKRDIKYYLSTRKQTNTTTSTAATAGTLTGTIAISSTIDLSEKYLINLSDGEDGSYQEIDCRGATPEATTKTEIITAINNATGRTMASTGGGDVIVLTGEGTGEPSYFEIKPPVTDADKDALAIIFGLSIGGVYRYTYQGTNEWFKLAEIDVGTSTTTITSALIRNIEKKDSWASETEDIIVQDYIYKKNVPEWNIYDSTVTYGFGDVAWIGNKQFSSIKAANSGNYPITSPDWWELAPAFEDILKDYQSAKPILPGIKTIDNYRDAGYEQWNFMGYYEEDGYSYEAYKVRLDGTVVTGDSDLENIFDVGGTNEYFLLDTFAPDVLGTRTLVDLRGRVLRPVDAGGGETENVGVTQDDQVGGQTHPEAAGTNFVINGSTILYTSGGSGPVYIGGSISNATGNNNTGAETRMDNYTVGVPYLVIVLRV